MTLSEGPAVEIGVLPTSLQGPPAVVADLTINFAVAEVEATMTSTTNWQLIPSKFVPVMVQQLAAKLTGL